MESFATPLTDASSAGVNGVDRSAYMTRASMIQQVSATSGQSSAAAASAIAMSSQIDASPSDFIDPNAPRTLPIYSSNPILASPPLHNQQQHHVQQAQSPAQQYQRQEQQQQPTRSSRTQSVQLESSDYFSNRPHHTREPISADRDRSTAASTPANSSVIPIQQLPAGASITPPSKSSPPYSPHKKQANAGFRLGPYILTKVTLSRREMTIKPT